MQSVLVGILTLMKQFQNKISAANIVNQVAEVFAAEGIVAQVLDD
jgi:hypothetical protein